METINDIKEITEGESWRTMGGFEVVTDSQSIKLLINNQQDCRENFGYFWCNDDPKYFIGAALCDVAITDKELNEAKMKENKLNPNDRLFEGGVMFVNLETDRGTLQFVAYNEHNGYYGHKAKVTCKQLEHSEIL